MRIIPREENNVAFTQLEKLEKSQICGRKTSNIELSRIVFNLLLFHDHAIFFFCTYPIKNFSRKGWTFFHVIPARFLNLLPTFFLALPFLFSVVPTFGNLLLQNVNYISSENLVGIMKQHRSANLASKSAIQSNVLRSTDFPALKLRMVRTGGWMSC